MMKRMFLSDTVHRCLKGVYFCQPSASGGDFLSFEEQCTYKYHIILTGYAASFSNSCWKYFVSSALFIPQTLWTQWYFQALEPYVHYIPLQEDLSDLLEKLQLHKDILEDCNLTCHVQMAHDGMKILI